MARLRQDQFLRNDWCIGIPDHLPPQGESPSPSKSIMNVRGADAQSVVWSACGAQDDGIGLRRTVIAKTLTPTSTTGSTSNLKKYGGLGNNINAILQHRHTNSALRSWNLGIHPEAYFIALKTIRSITNRVTSH